MLSGFRLCHTTAPTTKIEIRPNRQVRVYGPTPKSDAKYIEFAMSLVNVSEVICVESNEDCVDKFLKNQSDFSLNTLNIHNTSGKYSAPIPSYSSSLSILSGYNMDKYLQQEQSFSKNMQSVLANFTSYSIIIYACIILWMLSLFLIIWTNVLMVQRRRHMVRAILKSLGYFFTFIKSGSSRWFLPALVLNFGVFLLVTPFCILFKTKQVVVDDPKMITNYKQIIDERVQMVQTGVGDLSEFFKLGTLSQRENFMAEFVEYFQFNSLKVRLDPSPQTFDLLGNLSHAIVEGKQVVIGSDQIMEPLRQIFCSWTIEELYQMFAFRDPKQEELILGYIFPIENPPTEQLIKRLRHTFEAHLPSVLLKIFDNYAGIEMLPTSPEHRQRQLFLCQQRTLIPHRRKESLPADLFFFLPFFSVLFDLILVSIFIFAIELIVGFSCRCFGRKGSRKRRSRRVMPIY